MPEKTASRIWRSRGASGLPRKLDQWVKNGPSEPSVKQRRWIPVSAGFTPPLAVTASQAAAAIYGLTVLTAPDMVKLPAREPGVYVPP